MTYQEIKDRLSKCELTLEKFKNGVNIDNKEAQAKINKLTILKESLTKKLAEAQSKTYLVTPKKGQTTAVAMSDDETDALKDADDVKAIKGIDGEEIKEQEGIKFSVEETKSIAKKVGKAVAISLKSLGDSVKSMKAKNIEENSFDIQVNYKGEGPEDSFSFYITDDTLHLTDFSFDKEITDVGVKPSGEALVNVDVVANELQKHFKSMNEGEVSEAPEGMYYIKIPKDAASQNKAQVIFNDLHGINYELNDDPDGIFMYFKKEDFDAGVIDDLEGDGVHILDTNIPNVNEDAEEDAKNDADYEAGWHDDPRQDEDKDIGHQDDEPNMLGASALETAEYAAKLYKKLQRYDNFDGEVDFPHWWQKKLVLARDYMSAAFHYLDSEEKQPAIDKLALENLTFKEPKGIDKVAGGIPYRREGNKFIISMSLPDDVKERLLAKAKKNGFKAAPNQAGGVTIMAKDSIDERLSGDAREAIYDLQNILDQAAQLGDEARQIVKDNFPNELSAGEAYDVFSFGTSSNSYDKTLETLISDIERTAEEEDEDMDEGRKDKDALFPDNPRLPEIKNLADKIISMVKAEAAKGELGYIRTMEEIRYQQEDDFERTPEWNKAKGIRADFDDYGSGTNEGRNVDDLYDTTIHTMKRLAKKYKAGDNSVVPHLKKLTDIKKKLEQEKIKKASNIGKGQELDEGRGDGDAINDIIINMANEDDISTREAAEEIIDHITHIFINTKGVEEAELDKKEKNQVKKIVKQLKKSVKGHGNQAKYLDKLSKESAPGYKHDCAAKVVHEKYGEGNTIPEKHTLVKEGNKYVVTHYDVLFENGKTVTDIPVSELDVKTSNEHWHKGYKKKKK